MCGQDVGAVLNHAGKTETHPLGFRLLREHLNLSWLMNDPALPATSTSTRFWMNKQHSDVGFLYDLSVLKTPSTRYAHLL